MKARKPAWLLVAWICLGWVHFAVSAPVSEIPAIDRILEEHQTSLNETVDADYEKAVKELDEKYVVALSREMEKATADGDLDMALALKNEIARKKGEEVLADPVRIPKRIDELTKKYDEALATLKGNRDKAEKALNESTDARLERLEINFTKSGSLESAIAVRNQREEFNANPRQKGASGNASAPSGLIKDIIVEKLPAPDRDGWISLFDGERLHACDPEPGFIASGKIQLEGKVLRLKSAGIEFDVEAKDVAIRARMQKVSGKDVILKVRASGEGKSRNVYCFVFRNLSYITTGGLVRGGWKAIARAEHPAKSSEDGFYTMEFHIKGDRMTGFVDGVKMIDSKHPVVKGPGKIGISASTGTVAQFESVEYKVLD